MRKWKLDALKASKKKQALDVDRRDLGLSDDERFEEGVVRLVRAAPATLKRFFREPHEGPADVVSLAKDLVEGVVVGMAYDLDVMKADDDVRA